MKADMYPLQVLLLLGMFQEWFEIQMCSIVQDLDMDEPLELG